MHTEMSLRLAVLAIALLLEFVSSVGGKTESWVKTRQPWTCQLGTICLIPVSSPLPEMSG
jgi:hypothetical protein